MSTRQYCAMAALISLLCVAGGLCAAGSSLCVFSNDFSEGQGRVAKDSSGFHNDAMGIGPEYDPLFHWLPDGGISNSMMFIRQSAALQPASFLMEFNIKRERPFGTVDVFCSYVTPFYYKGPKLNRHPDAFWPMFYPLKITLSPNNNTGVDLMTDENGVIARKSFVGPKLPEGQFITLGIKLANGHLAILLNGKEEKNWPIKGQISYHSPEHYDGHVNAMLRTSRDTIMKWFCITDLAPDDVQRPDFGVRIRAEPFANFFAQDEKKAFDVGMANVSALEKKGNLDAIAIDINSNVIYQRSIKISLSPRSETVTRIVVPSNLRGCFWLKCVVTTADGGRAENEIAYGVGAIRDVRGFPDDSPFGFDSSTSASQSWQIPDTGAKWIRNWLSWAYMEPRMGEYQWEKADRAVNYYHDKGMKINGTFYRNPEWAVPERIRNQKPFVTGHGNVLGAPFHHTDQPERQKAFVRALATRYKGKIQSYDIWNEADANWQSSIEDYMEMLANVVAVLKEVDPGVIIGGPSSCAGSRAGGVGGSNVEKMMKLGALNYWDVFDTHYIGGSGGCYFSPEECVTQSIKNNRELLRRYGRELPIMDGESGYPLAQRNHDHRPPSLQEVKEKQQRGEKFIVVFDHDKIFDTNGVTKPHLYGAKCRDEYTLSRYYVRRMVLALSEGLQRTLVHNVGQMLYNSELQPILNGKYVAGVTLPVIAMATMTEKLSWAKYVRAIPLDDTNLYGHLFYDRKQKTNLAVFWAARGEQTVLLADAGKRAVLCDICGNPQPLEHFTKALVQLKLTEEPVYLELVESGIKTCPAPLRLKLPESLNVREAAKAEVWLANPGQHELKGTVTFRAPEGIDVTPGKIEFCLAPNQSWTNGIEFKVARTAPTGEQYFEAIMTSGDLAKPLTEKVVLKIDETPYSAMRVKDITIDGNDSDWPANAEVMNLGVAHHQVVLGLPATWDPACCQPDTEWQGQEDLSAAGRVAWNGSNVYLFLSVTDDYHSVTSRFDTPFSGDCVEVFMDGRAPGKLGEAYEAGVRHIRLVPCDTNYPRGSVSVKPVKGVAGDKWAIRMVCVKTQAGYNIEAAIPADKAFMPDLIMTQGRLIGFDLAVDDADRKGRKSQIVWRGKRDNSVRPASFGRIRLIKQ